MNKQQLTEICLETFCRSNNITAGSVELLSAEEGYNPWAQNTHSNDPNIVHTMPMPLRVLKCLVQTPAGRYLITIRLDGQGIVQWMPAT